MTCRSGIRRDAGAVVGILLTLDDLSMTPTAITLPFLIRSSHPARPGALRRSLTSSGE